MLKTCVKQRKAVLSFLKNYTKNTLLTVNAQLWMDYLHQPFPDSGNILEEGLERMYEWTGVKDSCEMLTSDMA